jgi:hypothetical protein
MSTLGFDKYVEPLKIYLAKYREAAKNEKPVSTKKMTQRRELESSILKVKQEHMSTPSSLMNHLTNVSGSGANTSTSSSSQQQHLVSLLNPNSMTRGPTSATEGQSKIVLPGVSSIKSVGDAASRGGLLFPESPFLSKDSSTSNGLLLPPIPSLGRKRPPLPYVKEEPPTKQSK